APVDIRRFETAQLALVFVGLVWSFTFNQPKFDAFGDAFGTGALIGTVIALGGIVGLTLLVTRGRKNWARWVLLAFYVVGVLLEIWSYRAILASGYPLMDIASAVLRGAILALAFTPESTQWLRASPLPA